MGSSNRAAQIIESRMIFKAKSPVWEEERQIFNKDLPRVSFH